MLKALSDLVRRWQAPEEAQNGEDDVRLAAAALLQRSIVIDEAAGPRESERLRAVLQEEYGVSGADLAALVAAAEQAEREAVDLYRFTRLLRERLDRDRRLRLVRRLWDLVLRNGEVSAVRDNFVWRVAELLGVERAERLRLKAEASAAAT
jgi:uncharacterized tellurite resistance protein B-like protein